MANNHSEIFNEHKPSLNSNGYLYCGNCHGYYSLNDDETPDDFVSCECGGELIFYESYPNFSEDPGFEEFDDLIEIEQLLTLLKSKSQKRKALIQNLSNHIQIQEGLLNEIKEERWNLWDVLNERNLQNDIKNQKRLLDDIAENEDRLLSIIREQRSRAHTSDKLTLSTIFKIIGTRGFIVIEFLVIILLLILLLV
jgi:hypothetical protein